jgi:hypothetical protein
LILIRENLTEDVIVIIKEGEWVVEEDFLMVLKGERDYPKGHPLTANPILFILPAQKSRWMEGFEIGDVGM